MNGVSGVGSGQRAGGGGAGWRPGERRRDVVLGWAGPVGCALSYAFLALFVVAAFCGDALADVRYTCAVLFAVSAVGDAYDAVARSPSRRGYCSPRAAVGGFLTAARVAAAATAAAAAAAAASAA
eukprot:gene24731-1972_t